MCALRAYVGVEHGDVKPWFFRPIKARDQTCCLLAARITGSVNVDNVTTKRQCRRRRLVGRKDMHSVGPSSNGRPTLLDRIVIAMGHEAINTLLGQTFERLPQTKLGAEAAPRTVIEIARKQDEVDSHSQCGLDERVKGVE